MGNCGLCGKPMYNPGQVICSGCKKASSKAKSRNASRMNRRMDEQRELMMNLASPGADEDVVEDMRREHYVDTHDATAVWARDGPAKKSRRRR